jgi:tetratricopeptide (TPR) repeat protein
MKLNLKVTPSLIKQYKKLLTSDWSVKTLPDILSLADKFFINCDLPPGFTPSIEAKSQLSNLNVASTVISLPPHLINYLQAFTAQINGIPSISKHMPKRHSPSQIEHARLTLEISYNFTFPIFVENRGDIILLSGEIGFLRDIQSLLFLLTSEYVLPDLQQEQMTEELNFLTLILLSHCLIAWHENPAHQNHLLYVLFENLGFYEMARERLYTAFKLTSPFEHEYMTKVQAYWTALIDAKRFDEAEEFLFRVLRHSPEEHFEELKEIIQLNFELRYQ